ncbi:hypothetical protein [Clostridium sp. AM58-1XD]|uniref:hypothetical protein n=1 Tax=Clostridium sp. AM58-1XD TaxID=2292307 RepID=UPI000E554C0F|nr:hypothetical protein [Clostridium sp. AM58-1XD]RGZ00171.1 hypothetical protein DXA13_06065 [Clostridium sp. AM58-1XD]
MPEKSYEEVLTGLYTTYKTNDKANEAFAEKYLKSLEDSMGVDFNPIAHEEDSLAAKLKSYSATVEQENLTVKIGEISYTDGSIPAGFEETTDMNREEETGRQQIMLENLQLTYVNPTTQVESSITVDLTIRTPRIRFINEKEALNDYVLVANKGIKIEENSADGDGSLLKGNIYGGNIEISQAKAVMESNLVTAGEELSVSNGGDLSIIPAGMGESDNESEEGAEGGTEEGMDQEYSMTSHVWAHNVRVFQASRLTMDSGDMYVQDDLTLQQDENSVKLTGGYYGYGNKGESAEPDQNTHSDSSAVLLNGKKNTVDFGEVDTLLLAGRAYLNFRDVSEAYPLGESMSVKASQNIYLVPTEQIHVGDENGTEAESNPLIFPSDKSELVLNVKKDGESGNAEGTYKVTKSETNGTVSYSASRVSGENTAVIVGIKGKLYIYRSFESKEEQTEFFRKYLEEHGDTFSSYLKKAGMGNADGEITGGDKMGAVTLNEGGNFYTSASLYEVSGAGEKLFNLMNNESPTSLGIVELSRSCELSYANLKKYLAETVKADGGEGALPASTFARLKAGGENGESVWNIEDFEVLHKQEGDVGILVTDQNVVLNLSSKEAKAGATYAMPQGLIVTNKNVTVEGGSGEEWNGLILAGGTITIKGEAKLIADPGTWASYLEDEQAAKYFYGYGDADSSAFDRYEDFLILKNWKRGTRIHEEG